MTPGTDRAGESRQVALPLAIATSAGARRPTSRQVEAVYAVMRLLRRDRASRGSEDQIWCGGCRRSRDRSGSATYGETVLCNGCATDYELLRLSKSVRDLEDFLGAHS